MYVEDLILLEEVKLRVKEQPESSIAFRVRGLPVHLFEVISHSKMFDFYSPLVCYKWLLIPLSNIPQKRHGLWYPSIYSG